MWWSSSEGGRGEAQGVGGGGVLPAVQASGVAPGAPGPNPRPPVQCGLSRTSTGSVPTLTLTLTLLTPPARCRYVPYVGDSKRAMDEYTSEIFMGGKVRRGL